VEVGSSFRVETAFMNPPESSFWIAAVEEGFDANAGDCWACEVDEGGEEGFDEAAEEGEAIAARNLSDFDCAVLGSG